ncbi:P-II family nitrogen regulator [Desulfovibrio sp. OttesenSCG-928-C06]|nr:P-II family nitrogen regulator [Desulfovibrio sp. OttesenSCG-928-C06]
MLDFTYLPGKLMIGIVGRHNGDHYVDITKAAGARGGTVSHGRSFAGNWLMQALALDDVSQDVVFTLMGREADDVIAAMKKAAQTERKKLGGIAVVLNLEGMRVRMAAGQKNEQTNEANSDCRSDKMESGHILITVIVNTGHANDVMAAARKAGATGGTILTARGTGTQEDVKFFSITLVPEKEILMIVAERSGYSKIMDAINTIPELCEPGGGIVYTMNVEEFVTLGK